MSAWTIALICAALIGLLANAYMIGKVRGTQEMHDLVMKEMKGWQKEREAIQREEWLINKYAYSFKKDL